MAVRSRADARQRLDIALPDRYRLGRPIAHGGMASVWSAYDRHLRREVAIKFLAEHLARDRSAVRRFRREARAAARLSGHPHVVSIFDVGETGDEVSESEEAQRPFLVMEHLPGGTVRDALRAGEVSRRRALDWLRQAASAVDYGHGRGVIHRDVKPQNFLLDADGSVRVADFGVATIVTEETITRAGQLLATTGYMSPEQALGEPATEASDRYAFAVTAFELLVGERPFDADNPAALARHHVEDRPPRASQRNPALPAAVDAVLARGMAKRPQQRWGSATEFVDALDAALLEPADVLAGAGVGGAGLGGGNAAAVGAAAGLGSAAAGSGAGMAFGGRSAGPRLYGGRGPRARLFALTALTSAVLGVILLAALNDHSARSHSTASRAAARPAPPRPGRARIHRQPPAVTTSTSSTAGETASSSEAARPALPLPSTTTRRPSPSHDHKGNGHDAGKPHGNGNGNGKDHGKGNGHGHGHGGGGGDGDGGP